MVGMVMYCRREWRHSYFNYEFMFGLYASKRHKETRQHLIEGTMVWMSVPHPLNFYVRNIMSKVIASWCGAVGRWLGHDGGAPMNGTSILRKEEPESELIFLSCENMRSLRPITELLPNHAGTLILHLQLPATWNKFLLFISYLVCAILL